MRKLLLALAVIASISLLSGCSPQQIQGQYEDPLTPGQTQRVAVAKEKPAQAPLPKRAERREARKPAAEHNSGQQVAPASAPADVDQPATSQTEKRTRVRPKAVVAGSTAQASPPSLPLPEPGAQRFMPAKVVANKGDAAQLPVEAELQMLMRSEVMQGRVIHLAFYRPDGWAFGTVKTKRDGSWGSIWHRSGGVWREIIAAEDTPLCRELSGRSVPPDIYAEFAGGACFTEGGKRINYRG